MYFEVEVMFGGERAPSIAKYSCETVDRYLARDVVLRDFLDNGYSEPNFVYEVVVYEDDRKIRYPYVDLDMEEYSTSLLYQMPYFRELMSKSKIECLGIKEEIY